MKIIIKKSFENDISDFDGNIFEKVSKLISFIEKNSFLDLLNIFDCKKIKGYSKYYRIRIGDYRIGLMYEGETLILVRIKLRKDIYKVFP